MKQPKSITDDQILEDIKRVAGKLGKTFISTGDYRHGGGKFSPGSASNHFGTWSNALIKAGLCPDPVEAGVIKHRETKERSNDKGHIRALNEELERVRKKLEVATAINDIAANSFSISGRNSGKGEATACAMASDWHIEEPVYKAKVNGVNEYNLDIARKSAITFFEKIVRLTEIERGAAKVDSLILCLGGDLISGYIHDELMESNLLSPLQAIEACEEMLSSGLDYLQKHFKSITVPCVYGNHGRTTDRARVSTGAENSYEWYMYRHLAKYYRAKPQVQFVIAEGTHAFVETYGLRLRFSHGDAIKYNGGIGGLTIPLTKAVDAWNHSAQMRSDYDFIGHFHQLGLHNGRAISNGSLIGYGPYSLHIKARFEPPQQAFTVFDGTRKTLSCFRPIWPR